MIKECTCSCHTSKEPEFHFAACCDGQCPTCGKWFKGLKEHMATHELQPGPELDAKIAEVCGIDVVPCENNGRIVKKGEHYDQLEGVPYVGKYGDFFEPSTDANAAFEAAEKCGLFNGNVSLVKSMRSWYVDECAETYGPTRPRRWSTGIGDTPALAICDAILTLTERRASSASPSS